MREASKPTSIRARVERALSPGLGFCYRCRRPWKTAARRLTGTNTWQQLDRDRFWGWIGVEEHITNYTQGEGCFPLCEGCWDALTPSERLPYYRRLWNVWLDEAIRIPHPTKGDDYILELNEKWPKIELAVLSGL